MTPLMSQYNAIKRQYKSAILLFRMGDFYETFGDDAVLVSRILDITLTSRDKNKDNTALAGFPFHALDTYLPKLVEKGHTVAIAEQVEDPAIAKGIVKRKVTRVITPGTILDGELLKSAKNNYLLAVTFDHGLYGIAYTDISTGEILTTAVKTSKELLNEVERISPSEILTLSVNLPDELSAYVIHPIDPKSFERDKISELVKEYFGVHNLGGLGFEKDDVSIEAMILLFSYIIETQFEIPKHIKIPKKYSIYESMILDSATIKSLNIVGDSKEGKDLFSLLNETVTSMGARLLYFLVLHPHINKDQIVKKLAHVQSYVDEYTSCETVRKKLKGVADIERILGKLGSGRCFPRDILAIKGATIRFLELNDESLLLNWKPNNEEFNKLKEIIDRVGRTIRDNPSNDFSVGGYINKGFSDEFDTAFEFATESERLLKEYESKLIIETGISTLKVKRNKIWGHYIELTNKYIKTAPEKFIHRQTLVNAARYTTSELVELEKRIIEAENSIINLELSIFNDLLDYLRGNIVILQQLVAELAYVDLISNFAYISVKRNYVKPEILSITERKLEICNGRHPIVSEVLKESFIPNNTSLSVDSFVHVVTGPNMSGKSTYLRQVALIILMAQIGCFVPADTCEFSICDRIFTRIGASDDISSGKSTFMVEMSEMSNILKNATKGSLVLLDEVGRGTSTYDGVSLAWAITKYIAENIGSFTLFATHYHELIQLKNYSHGIENYTVSVLESEDRGEVTFLYKIEKGETDKSYGVYVAKIAGIPKEILKEAESILAGFEQKKLFSKYPENKEMLSKIQPIPLFSKLNDPKMERIKDKLKDINIDEITPLQALSLLAEIVKINKNS